MTAALGRTWVIVPAYNEATVVADVVHSLRVSFPNVVVVDDGSVDDTANVAAAAGAHVLRHPVNLGQGAALQTGFVYCTRRQAGFVVTFDADGQHEVADVVRLLAALSARHLDVALGSRVIGHTIGMSLGRRSLLKAAVLFTRWTTGLKLTDAHNGLRAFTGAAAATIRLRHNRMAHASEILEQIARHKLKFEEVGNTVRYTDYSRAKGQKASNAIGIVLDLVARRMQK